MLVGNVDGSGARRDSDCGTSRGVNDGLRQDHAAALRRGDHDAFHPIALDECPAAERAVPDIGAGLSQFPPIPFDLHLAIPGLALSAPALGLAGQLCQSQVQLFREAFAVAVVVLANQAHRADAAQAVEVFHDESFGSLARRRDTRGGTTRAAPDDDRIVTTQYRHRPLLRFYVGGVRPCAHPGPVLADVAGRNGR